MWFYVIVPVCAFLFYKYAVEPLSYWKKKNVPTKPALPLFGHMWPLIARKISLLDAVVAGYQNFPDKRYNGAYQFMHPILVVRDLELVKQITIKDFEYFSDHRSVVSDKNDPLFARNLLALSGHKWKEMRAILSPVFTGSKMKAMFYLMSECSKEFANYFLRKEETTIEVEMKEVFSRYTNDIIASAAFGVSCNSLKDKDNEFFKMGRDITNVSGLKALKMLAFSMFPGLMKLFRMKIFPQASAFFEELVTETIKVRENGHIIRPDMIHLLMEAKKGKLKYEEDVNTKELGFATVEESRTGNTEKSQKTQLTDLDIAAQALLFFFAGFDTSSNVMSFMAHELALHVEVQEELQKEIDEVLEECKGDVTYEALLKMKYLDMVVSETLRKWSPGPIVERLCVKDYTIEPVNPDEKPVKLEKGDNIHIPVRGFHYDPKYFPNPDKFDPERFSDENKRNIIPHSYLPFGIGPRNCIGSRFALLEIKILMFQLLSMFNLVVIDKTCVPLTVSKKKLRMEPDNGFWIGLKKR